MKKNAFLSILNQNFPGEHAPRSLGATGPSYMPFGRAKFFPLGVTPVTTTATAVQNSIENTEMLLKTTEVGEQGEEATVEEHMQCEEQAPVNAKEADLHQLTEAESALGLPKDLDDSDDSGVDSD